MDSSHSAFIVLEAHLQTYYRYPCKQRATSKMSSYLMDQELVDMPKFDLEALLPVKTLDWEPMLQEQDEKLQLQAQYEKLKAIALEVVSQALKTAVQVHEKTVHQVQETMVIETQNTSVNPLLPSPALVAHLPPPLQMQPPFRYESHAEYLRAREQEQAFPPRPKRLRDDATVDERFDKFWREFVDG